MNQNTRPTVPSTRKSRGAKNHLVKTQDICKKILKTENQKFQSLMMTLKFSRNAKVTRALTGRRPVRPAADDDFEKPKKIFESEHWQMECKLNKEEALSYS